MRVGFIGAGGIAVEHLKAVRAAGGQVVAACSRGPSASQFAQQHDIAHHFHSPTEMIKMTRPDALFLITHPSSYPSILAEISPFGLPLLIEKPLAHSSEAAEALRPFLPKLIFVGLNRRFYSNVRPVREALQLQPGTFVHAVLAERVKDYCDRSEDDRNSWLLQNGIHVIDLLTYLVGEPKEFYYKQHWGTLKYSKLPQYTALSYRSINDHHVQFAINLDSPGGWRIHAFFPVKEMAISPLEKTTIRQLSSLHEVERSQDDIDYKAGFVGQTRCFFEGIRQGYPSQPEWISFDSALNSMVIVESFYR